MGRTAILALLLPLSGPASDPLDLVIPNDNRMPAGVFHGDTLEIHLEVRMATWRPEADSGPAVIVAAFAEEGKAAHIPGPLIRVPAGTTIIATLKNSLPDSALSFHGFLTHPGSWNDSLVLEPGESRALRFTAGDPGTYLYLAIPGKHNMGKDDEREQISGAFIVDPPGGSPPDRIFMMNIWGHQIDSTTYGNALTINGRSWPYDERIHAQVGDSVRWRVINGSSRSHPMHLHGFYYAVSSQGDGLADQALAPDARPLVVTQTLRPFETMSMAWSPDRPGQWLFHCHIGFHVVPGARVSPPGAGSMDRMSHDPTVHMAGLVLGIAVTPRPEEVRPSREHPRRLHLFVDEGHRRGRAARALGFVLGRGSRLPARDSVEIAGSPIILNRDVPTDIVVVNRLAEPLAVHWHGVELESYSDGVAGWSGAGEHVAPSIAANDSFVAHLTLPRAGTFIYHTHMNDLEQLSSGLYGAIVVLEPGERFNPARDHIFVAGWDGLDNPHILINGDSLPSPLELASGVTHRFRFVNIGLADRFDFSIVRDSSLVAWRRVAKDGAALPASQLVSGPATIQIDVGETTDTELSFVPGEYRLVVAFPGGKSPLYERRLIVR